jgi:protein involved in polysaccharide export with SLBB domain
MVSMSAHRRRWLRQQGRTNARNRIIGRLSCFVIFFAMFAPTGAEAQGSPGLLVSRSELMAAATQAELGATKGDYTERARSAMLAASIRQRLRDGDVQVGDRVVVTIISDTVHRDTIVVRSGRFLELPGMIVVPVTGVLRSELQDRVAAEVLKYVKAQRIEVTALMRVGVLGAVMRPGYFAFASDLPISDAIMGAGGPTGTADIQRSIVRRGNQEYRSADETRKAIAGGLTLDQLGLNAGDELVVGQNREFNASALVGMAAGLASVVAVLVAVHRR